jgi:hypothetical protein
MISKSKLGAIAFLVAISLAAPVFAQYGPQYSPYETGGGSPGYNYGLRHYRLKHHVKPHAAMSPSEKKISR